MQILKSNWEQVPKQSIFTIDLSADVNTGGVLEIYIKFEGLMFNNTSEGLFRSSYVDSQTKQPKWWDCFNITCDKVLNLFDIRYVATFMRPNMARTVFPCFDEPSYKVPVTLTVVRPNFMKAVFNMPLESSSDPK